MSQPKTLIVAIGRLNAADAANNGLLVRNLFSEWPKERLAQIFGSGDNGDEGFCGSYYQIGREDRRLGRLFYRLRNRALRDEEIADSAGRRGADAPDHDGMVRGLARRLLVETGLYELLFAPRLSHEMLAWARAFGPDRIFAQGYSYAFALLPVMLARELRLPVVYYPTDDWPNGSYRANSSSVLSISRLVARTVEAAAKRLVKQADVLIAFNEYMKEEYRARYGREFAVLMHGDEPGRFALAGRTAPAGTDGCVVVTTGAFNKYRIPLLEDLDVACDILRERGIRARGAVFPVLPIEPETARGFRNLACFDCPGHDELAGVLRAADVLFLPERFDQTAEGIRLSVSSKAHLYMFAERPIVVYSDERAGVARYAREEGWGVVVQRRAPDLLANAIETMYRNAQVREAYVSAARGTAMRNHSLVRIREEFRRMICDPLGAKEGIEK